MAMFDSAHHLRGYMCDLPTPFDVAVEVDLVAFARLCQRQVAAGTGSLVVCSARGEASTLTQSERTALIRCAVLAANGRVPVIAGTSSNDTARAVVFAQDAERAGASAVLSSVPYYNKPTQAGIKAHFRTIADACSVPMILHDEPGRCVRGLADETVVQLTKLPQIVGLCDAGGDVARLARLRAMVGRDIRLLSSDDVSAPAFIAFGGDGCISGACAVAPSLYRTFYHHASTGDMAKARRLSVDMETLAAALAAESEPAPLKHALARTGMLAETLRLPLLPVSKATRAVVADALAALRGWIDCNQKPCVDAG